MRLGRRKEYWYPRQNQNSDWPEPSPRSNRRQSEVPYSNRSRGGDRHHKDKFGSLRKRSFSQSHHQRPKRGPFVPKQVNSIVVKPAERINQGKIYPRMTIISDSICKRVSIPHVHVQSIGGLRINTAERYIKEKLRLNISDFDIIIIHVGTLDVEALSVKAFTDQYCQLVKTILSVNPNALLGLSAIIPRLCDFNRRNRYKLEEKRQILNQEIRRIAVWERLIAIDSSKKFFLKYEQNQVDDSCFYEYDPSGLHLNGRGAEVLSLYFSGSFALLKGIWRKRND